jgi:serine/threonine protein kinase
MGEVYLARHPRLPRRDAVKVLPAGIWQDPTFRERFIREADLASGLWHPNVVSVYDRGEHGGQLWIAMEFADGTDAGRLLAGAPGGLPVKDVLAIVTAVAAALDHAHARGLLHRDVKPANIMLAHHDASEDRRMLLADFGIARPLDEVSGLTTTNMTVGTVAYAAPEQLMGERVDGRADEYSLAATAYHLLSGEQLFPQSNPAVVISRHLNADPPPLAGRRPELAGLDPVLARALAKEPADRYAHARILLEHSPLQCPRMRVPRQRPRRLLPSPRNVLPASDRRRMRPTRELVRRGAFRWWGFSRPLWLSWWAECWFGDRGIRRAPRLPARRRRRCRWRHHPLPTRRHLPRWWPLPCRYHRRRPRRLLLMPPMHCRHAMTRRI